MKLKFSCLCGKRLLAPTHKIGKEETCPRCSEKIRVPLFGMPAFRMFICSCGSEYKEQISTCSSCQQKVPQELLPSEKIEQPIKPKYPSKPLPHLKLKFKCDCGKRLLIFAHQEGKKQVCTNCSKELTLPNIQDSSVIGVYCDCSKEIPPQESSCPSCKKQAFEESSSPKIAKIKEITEKPIKEGLEKPKKEKKEKTTQKTSEIKPVHLALAIGIPILFMSIVAFVLVGYMKKNQEQSGNQTENQIAQGQKTSENPNDLEKKVESTKTVPNNTTSTKEETKTSQNPTEDPAPKNATKTSMKNEMGNGEMIEQMVGDKSLHYGYFKAHIAPIMSKTCATTECHGGSEDTGKLKLVTTNALGQFSEEALNTNFNRIQPFAKPGLPRSSRLFLKPLDKALGGIKHGGGNVLKEGTKRLSHFEKFLSGEKLENIPPVAIAGEDKELEIGKVLVLDGGKSYDPNEDSLNYSWKFISTPENKTYNLTNQKQQKAAFTPKDAGEYIVQLVVSDGVHTSLPDRVKITIFSKAVVTAIEESKKQKEKGLTEAQISKRRYLRKLFLDTLNRSPNTSEYARFQNQENPVIVDHILGSYEFWENWYEDELFYFLLIDNFRPANESLLSLAERIQKKELNPKQAIQAIVISQYFNNRNPGNDTWVTVVFEQLLGMKVQEKKNVKHLKKGKKMYDRYKQKLFNTEGKNQADVVNITMNQGNFYQVYIQRHYKRYFGEDIPFEVLQSETEQFQQNPANYSQIVKKWLLSDKYQQSIWKLRPKSDFKFIRGLYIDLLGRRPTFEEYRLLRNALQALSDSRPLRSIMVKIMVESSSFRVPEKGEVKDPKKWIQDQFIHYLCRRPTTKELETWASIYQNRFCSPKLMIQALLLNREYNSY